MCACTLCLLQLLAALNMGRLAGTFYHREFLCAGGGAQNVHRVHAAQGAHLAVDRWGEAEPEQGGGRDHAGQCGRCLLPVPAARLRFLYG